MTLHHVLDALHYNGPRNRDSYNVICPAHEDHNPSLSISVGEDDTVLIHCHAGCKTAAILKTVGLTWADLKPEQRQNGMGSAAKSGIAPGEPKAIFATYDYCDTSGKLVFQVVRFEPKDFRQRRPDGRGGWVWDTKGIKLVPYRLPELLAAPANSWVFIVEGEKDADNLARLELVATCNAQGAGKWRGSYDTYFADRRVCILPDNDERGREHAQTVAEHLVRIAKMVRVVELPGLPDKGDVSDWLAGGGSAKQLLTLVFNTPDWVDDKAVEESATGKATAIRKALAEMKCAFRYNQLRERIEHPNGDALHDGELATIIAELFDHDLSNKQLMLDVILADAWAHGYDPLIDFLNGLKWDGHDHIAQLSYHFEDRHPLIVYPDATKRTVFHAFLHRFLVGAAARGLGHPVQVPMLVMVGDQGIGKSEFAQWLCSPLPGYFVESAINPESVDHQRWATSNWIWECGELGATTRRADVEMLKAFLTRHEHSYRVPYARNEVHKPTRASFIGTINPDNAGFLMDATGNRRFLTAEIVAIDWPGYTAKIDVRQVWAQAAALYAQDKNAWQLDETEHAVRDQINGEFGMEDPVRDAILASFNVQPGATPGAGDFVSNTDLVFHVGTYVRSTTTRALQMDIARALKRIGVTKGKRGDERGYWGVKKRFAANL